MKFVFLTYEMAEDQDIQAAMQEFMVKRVPKKAKSKSQKAPGAFEFKRLPMIKGANKPVYGDLPEEFTEERRNMLLANPNNNYIMGLPSNIANPVYDISYKQTMLDKKQAELYAKQNGMHSFYSDINGDNIADVGVYDENGKLKYLNGYKLIPNKRTSYYDYYDATPLAQRTGENAISYMDFKNDQRRISQAKKVVKPSVYRDFDAIVKQYLYTIPDLKPIVTKYMINTKQIISFMYSAIVASLLGKTHEEFVSNPLYKKAFDKFVKYGGNTRIVENGLIEILNVLKTVLDMKGVFVSKFDDNSKGLIKGAINEMQDTINQVVGTLPDLRRYVNIYSNPRVNSAGRSLMVPPDLAGMEENYEEAK